MLAYLLFLVIFLCLMDGLSGYVKKESVVTATGNLNIPSEPLNITLAIFSGNPDPTWLLRPNNKLYQNIRRQLDTANKKGLTYSEENMPSKLGYKGFIVKSAAMSKPVLVLGPNTVELQKLLLQTRPVDKNSNQFQKILLIEIEKSKSPATGRTVKRMAPDFNPAPWNALFGVLLNNCYNYATNQPTDTFAQPGRRSGNPLPPVGFTDHQVQQAAESDGLETLHGPDIPNLYGPWNIPPAHMAAGHLVALFVSPVLFGMQDFHWYRLDSNGLWSHKPGRTDVTGFDRAGDPILDPRTACHGLFPNYQFVCFMTTTNNTLVL